MERPLPPGAQNFEARRETRESGFEVVWEMGEPGKMQYSLVEVPSKTKFGMIFRKPERQVECTMQPAENSHLWTVAGEIDPDVISNLGLPVTRIRHKKYAPYIDSERLSDLQVLGHMEEIDYQKYNASIMVTPEHISNFLNAVWIPPELRQDPHTNIPGFRLDAGDLDAPLLLPQREPPRRNRYKRYSLLVYKQD